MQRWIISKYNPCFIDENGYYCRDEWCEFSQIGDFFGAQQFKPTEYFQVEEKMVNAVMYLLKEINVDRLQVTDLWNPLHNTEPIYYFDKKGNKNIVEENPANAYENIFKSKYVQYSEYYDDNLTKLYYNIRENDYLRFNQISNAIKLNFRHHIFCKLVFLPKIVLDFPGRMYVWADVACAEKIDISQIVDMGLFVRQGTQGDGLG